MFIKGNTMCNDSLYERGQEVDKKDENYTTLKDSGLLLKNHPDAMVSGSVSDDKEVKALTERVDELEKALAKANEDNETIVKEKDEAVVALAGMTKEFDKLEKALAKANAK